MDRVMNLEYQSEAINDMTRECYGRSYRAGWYRNPINGEPIIRNVPEMLCLIHSEISEALEGYRKGLRDDHFAR
jgi:hypothetical protein